MDSLLRMLDDLLPRDLKVIAEGQSIEFHTTVLACRSPVFEHIFAAYPDKPIVLRLDDVEFAVLKSVSDYVYDEKIDDDYKMQCKMYAFAKKYHMEALKNECLRLLTESVRDQNAFALAVFAYHNECDDLRLKAISILSVSNEKLSKVDGWGEFIAVRPLVDELRFAFYTTREDWR
ncbi:unnamed protein product [Caenorhabditis auriculariae]|uniref:BTB domain-containing protein n=1 Tax=Caenorhabditis auriculariae TaxID=2777116 RepID=A0A8S1GU41_9PELO|nr:unnamed protein product [Caenorhabditis auriculariae]